MFNSADYWNNRYKKGENSGSGSYNQLAQFKADVINEYIRLNGIKSMIDYGMGDGNQLKLFNISGMKYVGIDVSQFIVDKCKEEFPEQSFYHVSKVPAGIVADMVISCDVLYHIVEMDKYHEYIDNLFKMSSKHVVIYARDENINHQQHVVFRKFTTYIVKKFPEWRLVKIIRNKYPQPKIGINNDKTSPSDFFIYKKDDVFQSLIVRWKNYIEANLMPIIKGLGVELEGNIYSSHKTFDDCSEALSNKRHNIYNLLMKLQPKRVLEIGFNSGFSALLIKMICPDCELICVDLNEHKYVVPCFEKVSGDYGGMRLIPQSSYGGGLQKLISEGKDFDVIHLDGDHRIEGATKDLDLSLQLSNHKTVIIFDDTNLAHLNQLCSRYVDKGLVMDYPLEGYLNNQKYKHRFLKVKREKRAKPILICGFPHSGTSILKAIIGHVDGVKEKIKEMDWVPDGELVGENDYVVLKTPYMKKEYLGDKYKGYIKIFIMRNPVFVYSSMNKRYEGNVPKRLHFDVYKKTLEMFLGLRERPVGGVYTILYEEMFGNNYAGLRRILDGIGLQYGDEIFDNKKYTNYIVEKKVPDVCPLPTDHDKYRTYQINQEFKNMNKIANVDLTREQMDEILGCDVVRRLFDVGMISGEERKEEVEEDVVVEVEVKEKPVYVSVTSIFSNQSLLYRTLVSITKQSRKPTAIYVYLSEEGYLLDKGFEGRKITDKGLEQLIQNNKLIEVRWVKNIGSYRKLVPLLRDKWNEDCIIITIDDDTIYTEDLIENLVNDYNEHGCMIGYRGFTPKFKAFEDFDYKRKDKAVKRSLYNFLTGKGGILYVPSFFHGTGDLVLNESIFMETCDKGDDIWFYILRVKNGVECVIGNRQWMVKDLPNKGLFKAFNSNDNNTIMFRNTMEKLCV